METVLEDAVEYVAADAPIEGFNVGAPYHVGWLCQAPIDEIIGGDKLGERRKEEE